jgi:acyl-CoA synthetase (AMP-forming)/AMP-acid ligase II
MNRFDTSARSVFEAFVHTAHRRPDADFLVLPASATCRYADGPISYRYAGALSEIETLLPAYRASGLGPGMRVATLLENRPASFFHWLALNSLGVSVVPVNPDYRAAEIRYLLEHSEAALVVTIPERRTELEAIGAALPRPIPVVEASSVPNGLARIGPERESARPTRDTECAVLYTSGTMGRPKGCLLTNDYFIRCGLRYLSRKGPISLRPDCERLLTPLPMFHMNAMASTTLSMVLSGGCVILLDRFHPASWWQDVAETAASGIHYLGVMPAILLGMPESASDRAHRVRYGFGANVEPRHHAAFEQRFGFPLIEGWAMTETGSGASISAEEDPRHVGTRCFGRVPPNVELRLVDELGKNVAAGEPGEMLVRCSGPNPRLGFFSGYHKDEAATAAGWEGGWWHTGDMARRGPDGSLHYVDRKKNVIRRSGENIATLEVEEILRAHPAVSAVAVTAVHDDVRGDEVLACLVAAPGAPTDNAAAEELVRWMLERAAYYKAPGWVAYMASLPTTPTQKVDRAGLKANAAQLLREGSCFDTRDLKRRDVS